jgi:cob(I)alamin adenosyltransferase
MTKFYTTLGDDGYTSLLGPERVPKYHPQPEAYGTVDETSAAMGLARAWAQSERTKAVLLQSQRHLYKLMAELATTPQTARHFPAIAVEDVAWLTQQTDAFSAELDLPPEFVAPGDSVPGAALDLARTVARRAERMVVKLVHEGITPNAETARYLNRLSSLLFVLARYEDALAGVSNVTLAKESETQNDS